MNFKERNKLKTENRKKLEATTKTGGTVAHGTGDASKPDDSNHQNSRPKDPKKADGGGWGGGITDRDRVMVEYGWWVGRVTTENPNADDVAKGADRMALIRKELGLHLETIGTDFNPRVTPVPPVPPLSAQNATSEIVGEVLDGQ